MGNSGVCCGNLEEHKGLMKMGLCMVLVGHVNFLLAALVHGVVLRHFSLQRGQAMESAISNVIALAAGLLGVIIGILIIVLSKNWKNRVLSTTIVLWVPLILMSAVEMVFSCRLFKVSISYLGLPWCLRKQHLPDESTPMKTLGAAEPRYSPPSRRCQGDEARKLSAIRPPEMHGPPPRSASSGRRGHRPSASPFSRAALERSSIWI
ncbi:transmembrane protein 54b isoform X3 [Puntigrus tetrazona]|uniref:transmembrane protein 54b isoform X3 n=1 Tax=Puntigrus tetrazona TaxID=1606681 RepID=UPI001C8A1A85|nr:transmembrane protein 54b isoform X3 [Puntigrus tetrazona]